MFVIDIDAELDEQLLERIAKESYSRIPVYQTKETNIVGVLLTKVNDRPD